MSPELGAVLVTEKNGPRVPLRGRGLAVVSVSVAGVPLEVRRVCGQFQGARGPRAPTPRQAPWPPPGGK
jgi:hypothetical protein